MSPEITTSRKTIARPRGYISDYRPQAKTLGLLQDVETVLHDYRQYWPLTIRQVFYRLVSTCAYPKTEQFYSKLCHHMANARRGRRIPFSAIRDDGVTTISLNHFDNEEHFLRHVRQLSENYTRNKLASQSLHVEVWCEAAGMLPQLFAVTESYSIKVYSSSGFDSLTAKKSLADRIGNVGKDTLILHLGDYDPSGESIFDSASEDVSAFLAKDWPGIDVMFSRVALTAGQVEQYNLPTAPPKATDSRAKRWIGETCQLEALPPDLIAQLLEEQIRDALSPARLAQDHALEEVDRRRIALALPAPGRTLMNAPHGTPDAYREYIGEMTSLAKIQAELATTYAAIGDDTGLRYAVSHLVAYTRAAVATLADLQDMKQNGGQHGRTS